jgi:hypothetical protein
VVRCSRPVKRSDLADRAIGRLTVFAENDPGDRGSIRRDVRTSLAYIAQLEPSQPVSLNGEEAMLAIEHMLFVSKSGGTKEGTAIIVSQVGARTGMEALQLDREQMYKHRWNGSRRPMLHFESVDDFHSPGANRFLATSCDRLSSESLLHEFIFATGPVSKPGFLDSHRTR